MGWFVNTSTEPIRQKLYTLKKILYNGEVYILGLAEVNIDWIKLPLKDNIYTIGCIVGIKQEEKHST